MDFGERLRCPKEAESNRRLRAYADLDEIRWDSMLVQVDGDLYGVLLSHLVQGGLNP